MNDLQLDQIDRSFDAMRMAYVEGADLPEIKQMLRLLAMDTIAAFCAFQKYLPSKTELEKRASELHAALLDECNVYEIEMGW